MSSTSLTYLMRTPDGKEYGPVDQDMLVQWAQAGRVTPECEISNTLIKQWTPATKIAFLQGHLIEQADGKGKGKQVSSLRKAQSFSLGQSGVFKYKPAGPFLRFGALLLDWGMFAILGAVLLQVCYHVGTDGVIPVEVLFMAATLLFVILYLLYYTLSIGLTAQTLGQWFFGIMLSRPDGEPVLLGRALMFTVLHLVFWWTTPPFAVIPRNKRALQERLCGCVVTMITNRERM